MKNILAFIKLILLFFLIILGFMCSIFIQPIVPQKIWHNVFIRTWARLIILTCCAKIITDCNLHKKINPTIIIANHLSWFDIPLILSLQSASFVAMIELKSWPIISHLVKSAGTIFIDRKSKKSITLVNNDIKDKLECGSNVVFFPEGKISHYSDIAQFKSSLFQVAIDLKKNPLLIKIEYLLPNGTPASQLNYYGNINILQSVWNVLKLNKFHVKISQAIIQIDDCNNREQLAAKSYKIIKELV